MPPLVPGFYCFTAMNARDAYAGDRQGPFMSLYDLCEWLVAHNVDYRPDRGISDRPVIYFGEMTGDESAGMWATGIHGVAPQYAKNDS